LDFYGFSHLAEKPVDNTASELGYFAKKSLPSLC